MRKLLGGLMACCMMIALSGCGTSNESSDVKTVGIIQQLNHPALDEAKEGMLQYFKDKGYDETKIKFVEKNAQGDNGTADTIAKQFINDGVDLIYSIGTNASSSAINAANGTTPVIFNAVTDAVYAKLVDNNEKPGKNVTGVSDAAPLEIQLKLIRDILPNAKTIGMIYNIGEPNGKIQVDQVKELADKFGFTIEVKGISVATDVATAAEQLASKVDCIYNITDNMVVNATASIVDKANNYKIPVFAAEAGQIDAGLLASDSISYINLGNEAGAMIEDILFNGKKAGDIAVKIATETKLHINKKTAETLGITIPADLDKRATYTGE